MSPRFVKPYRKSDKNDANDAEAICEAVTRPSMRFVPIKSEAQHEVQALHRVREQLLKSRTALVVCNVEIENRYAMLLGCWEPRSDCRRPNLKNSVRERARGCCAPMMCAARG